MGSPGPQLRWKLRGIWSRPTLKGEVEGIYLGGACSGGSALGGLLWGGACSGGCLLWGGLLLRRGGDPLWRLLQRAVRILLEFILVTSCELTKKVWLLKHQLPYCSVCSNRKCSNRKYTPNGIGVVILESYVFILMTKHTLQTVQINVEINGSEIVINPSLFTPNVIRL